MSPRKVSKHGPQPFAWKGFWHDLDHWRELGADAVLGGSEVVIGGQTITPIWRWFDQDRPINGDLVERLFCGHCGIGPIGSIWRSSQAGRETVAVIRYQQRKRHGDGGEMLVFEAIVHRDSGQCDHGPLLMHAEDQVTTHCRVHDLTVSGDRALRAVTRAGWEPAEDDPQPVPKRDKIR